MENTFVEVEYLIKDIKYNFGDWRDTSKDFILSKFMSNNKKNQKIYEIKTITNAILQRNQLNIPYNIYLEKPNFGLQFSLLENARNFRISMEYQKESIFHGEIKIFVKSHIIGKMNDKKVQHLLHEISHGIYEIYIMAKFYEHKKLYTEIDKLKKHLSFIEIPELAIEEKRYDILFNEENMEDQKNKERFCEGFSHYLLNLPIRSENGYVILNESEEIDKICKKIIQYLQPYTKNRSIESSNNYRASF